MSSSPRVLCLTIQLLHILYLRGAKIFKHYSSHLKTLGAGRVKCQYSTLTNIRRHGDIASTIFAPLLYKPVIWVNRLCIYYAGLLRVTLQHSSIVLKNILYIRQKIMVQTITQYGVLKTGWNTLWNIQTSLNLKSLHED
jgi:hypothetical protein